MCIYLCNRTRYLITKIDNLNRTICMHIPSMDDITKQEFNNLIFAFTEIIDKHVSVGVELNESYLYFYYKNKSTPVVKTISKVDIDAFDYVLEYSEWNLVKVLKLMKKLKKINYIE